MKAIGVLYNIQSSLKHTYITAFIGISFFFGTVGSTDNLGVGMRGIDEGMDEVDKKGVKL